MIIYIILCIFICKYMYKYVYKYILIYIQGVPGGMCQIRESVRYVKLYRYNPKHLCPK